MRFSSVTFATALFVLTMTSGAQDYRVGDHWKIGGEGGWDYLVSDAAAHRLYVTHNARVEVVDSDSGKLIGAVSSLKSTHGVALNSDGKTGYISDGAGNAIVIFDRETLSIKATVPAGTNPDGIVFEPETKTVWAFNGRSKNASVLDATTNQIIATVALPGKPEAPATDDGSIFVNIEDKNTIAKIDAKTKKVTAIWPLMGCDSPSGIAIDPIQHRLFSVCDGGTMAIVDDHTGKVLGSASIGESPDAAQFDAKRGLAFSSNGGDGTLSVIDTNKPGFPTVQSLKTAKGARTMTMDDTTGTLYLSTAQYGPPSSSPTAERPHPRPSIVPGTFQILVVKP